MTLESLIPFVTQTAIAIGIGLAGYILMRLVGGGLQNLLERYFEHSVARFLSNIGRLAIILGTIQFIINYTGTAGALVIVVTALTGAFAIGSERLASDFVAGVKLFSMRHYKVGDWITVNGTNGEVMEITLTQTLLRTEEQDLILLPNSDAADVILINHTALLGHATPITMPILGTHDRKAVMALLRRAAATFPTQLEGEQFDPEVYLHGYGNNTTLYRVIVWVHEDIWSFRNAYNVRLILADALEEAGFEVGSDVTHLVIS